MFTFLQYKKKFLIKKESWLPLKKYIWFSRQIPILQGHFHPTLQRSTSKFVEKAQITEPIFQFSPFTLCHSEGLESAHKDTISLFSTYIKEVILFYHAVFISSGPARIIREACGLLGEEGSDGADPGWRSSSETQMRPNQWGMERNADGSGGRREDVWMQSHGRREKEGNVDEDSRLWGDTRISMRREQMRPDTFHRSRVSVNGFLCSSRSFCYALWKYVSAVGDVWSHSIVELKSCLFRRRVFFMPVSLRWENPKYLYSYWDSEVIFGLLYLRKTNKNKQTHNSSKCLPCRPEVPWLMSQFRSYGATQLDFCRKF